MIVMARKNVTMASGILQAIQCRKTVPGSEAVIGKPDESMSLLPLGNPFLDKLTGGGLRLGNLHEMRCSHCREAGALAGFAIGLLSRLQSARPGHVVWVFDPSAFQEVGQFCADGFSFYGVDPALFTFVVPRRLEDAMWAADQAAACRGISAIVFHVQGNPVRFDLTATRRLMMRAGRSGTLVCILRQGGAEEGSAVTTRWQIKPALSGGDVLFSKGVGPMRLALTLERNRSGRTGHRLVEWNPRKKVFDDAANPAAEDHLPVISPIANRSDSPSSLGQILAHHPFRQTG